MSTNERPLSKENGHDKQHRAVFRVGRRMSLERFIYEDAQPGHGKEPTVPLLTVVDDGCIRYMRSADSPQLPCGGAGHGYVPAQ